MSDITGTEYAAITSAAKQVQMQRAAAGGGSGDAASTARKTAEALHTVDAAQKKVAASTGYSTNQMLQFTAAARNTAESLASGMSVSTVAMTQGMQILGAMVGENLKLMRNLGITAAVAAVAVVPLIRALKLASEARELGATIAAYNSYGMSLENAATAARKMADASRFSRSEAGAAIKDLIKSRELSAETRQGIMGIATDFAIGTGRDLKEAVKELNDAFSSGYEGVRKLDEVYGFLSEGQLTLIRNMMKSGDVMGAQRIALSALSKQMREASDLAKSAGERSFVEMAASWNKVLDGMANHPSMKAIMQFLTIAGKGAASIFEVSSIDEYGGARARVQNAELALSKIKERAAESGGYDKGRYSQAIAAAERQLSDARIELAKRESEAIVKGSNDNKRAYEDEIIAKDKLRQADEARAEAIRDSAKTEAEILRLVNFTARENKRIEREANERFKGETNFQLAKEAFIKGETDKVKAAQEAAIDGIKRQIDAERALTDAAKISARAMLEARAAAAYADARTRGNEEFAIAERNKVIIEGETQALRALHEEQRKGGEELALVNKIGDARGQALRNIVVEHMLSVSVFKTAEDRAKAEAAINKTLDDQIKKMQMIFDVETRTANQLIALQGPKYDRLTDTERRLEEAKIAAYAKREATIGDGKDPMAIMRAEKQLQIDLAKAEQDRAKAIAERERQVREMTDPTIRYHKELAAIKELNVTEDQRRLLRIQAEREYEDAIIRRLDMEEDWASGAERGWRRYIQSVGDAATQTEELMGRSLRDIEDMFVDFVMKGELNFRKFADSFIEQLIRMEFRLQMSNIHKSMGGFSGLASTIGGFFSGGGGGDSGGGGFGFGFDNLFSAHGHAFNDNGNVIPFARGGMFTNSIVNQPTQFRFARGAGLMGEAGPEAIVPLTRTPTGDLGVRSVGGGGAGVTVEVYDQRSGNAAPIDVETQMGAFGPIVRIIARDEATKAVAAYSKGGGLSNQLRSDFNIRQPAISRG